MAGWTRGYAFDRVPSSVLRYCALPVVYTTLSDVGTEDAERLSTVQLRLRRRQLGRLLPMPDRLQDVSRDRRHRQVQPVGRGNSASPPPPVTGNNELCKDC